MELWKQLLSDDVGVLSLITIVVASLVVSVCVGLFIKKTHDAPKK
ncbi:MULTISPECIES: DUF3149 domain-containing protein [Gulbenkiania]|uniref:DUF3149 domain-containing protein n=2 Tax=Gulbenkiania TaxID=397456 RepID=A0A0K6GSZ2_9NEIS|nr:MULTISPECIES: DUF3149 domain-containing protein [Gulbenkiania]TCW32392.1 uncharacterized protein DUF3149 [Gulbenkiania mobilis]CUA81653.1 Protein of unknown function (DUF3149) [Gulbenkiania indica]